MPKFAAQKTHATEGSHLGLGLVGHAVNTSVYARVRRPCRTTVRQHQAQDGTIEVPVKLTRREFYRYRKHAFFAMSGFTLSLYQYYAGGIFRILANGVRNW